MKYRQLTQTQRYQIYARHDLSISQRQIGRELGSVRKVGLQALTYTSYAYHCIKAAGQLLLTCRDTAALLEPAEQAFHDVPMAIFGLIKAAREARTRFTFHLSLGDDGLDPNTIAVTAQRFAIVPLVSHDKATTFVWPAVLSRQTDLL